MSAQVEVWRVSTVEGVFETDLETLKQWIDEGCVLPTDKVSKGSLSWIDAGRAPMLRAAFSGEAVPVVPAEAEANQTQPAWQAAPAAATGTFASQDSEQARGGAPASSVAGAVRPANACYNHPEAEPKYLCRMCAALLCESCPKFAGASKIPLCTLCGDLCNRYEEIKARTVSLEFQSSGFGLADFGRAIRYPFQHKFALGCGALIYSLLLLAGFRGGIVAYVIMFACISHVISQVAWGRLHRSFMPDLSEFSLWDDFMVPLGLGIGITIVTWGPIIALVLALLFGVLSGPSPSPLSAQQMQTQSSAPTHEDLSVLADPEADPEKLKAANEKL